MFDEESSEQVVILLNLQMGKEGFILRGDWGTSIR